MIFYFLFLKESTTRKGKETKHAHKNMEINGNTTKTNTNYKLHRITTCNKGNKSSEADSFRNKK
jgi:hypothetical protein